MSSHRLLNYPDLFSHPAKKITKGKDISTIKNDPKENPPKLTPTIPRLHQPALPSPSPHSFPLSQSTRHITIIPRTSPLKNVPKVLLLKTPRIETQITVPLLRDGAEFLQNTNAHQIPQTVRPRMARPNLRRSPGCMQLHHELPESSLREEDNRKSGQERITRF